MAGVNGSGSGGVECGGLRRQELVPQWWGQRTTIDKRKILNWQRSALSIHPSFISHHLKTGGKKEKRTKRHPFFGHLVNRSLWSLFLRKEESWSTRKRSPRVHSLQPPTRTFPNRGHSSWRPRSCWARSSWTMPPLWMALMGFYTRSRAQSKQLSLMSPSRYNAPSAFMRKILSSPMLTSTA